MSLRASCSIASSVRSAERRPVVTERRYTRARVPVNPPNEGCERSHNPHVEGWSTAPAADDDRSMITTNTQALSFNTSLDVRPAAVAYPRSVEDVVTAVAYARERGLRVSPQATGHNLS